MNERRKAFMQEFSNFRVDVPEGREGVYEIKRIKTSDRDAKIANAAAIIMRTDRFSMPGTFTTLTKLTLQYQTEILMTDHNCEVADHADLLAYAKAHAPLKSVLINGLGIGVAIELLAPYVERFIIVELAQSVIDLVAPHYQARYPGRIEVRQHDALTYQPPKGERYDACFHDIWSYINADNLPQMTALQRRYARRCDYQESWARPYCERAKREVARSEAKGERRIDIGDVYASLNKIYEI